jgi:PKD domain
MNRTRALVACTAALVLAAPAAASAETFCVHAPAGCVGVTEGNLQDALDAAKANGSGRDTIRIGQGLFNDGPAVDDAGNPVDIVGIASNKTAITSSSTTSGLVILDIEEPTTTISDLRVHHSSAAPIATGIKLRGDARNVLVTNQGLAGQFDGIAMFGTEASLADSGVDLVYPNNLQNRAVFVTSGADVTIRDSSLRGTIGVLASGGDAVIQRARIQATQGVVASGGATVQVSDSRVVVPGALASSFTKAALIAAGTGATTLNVDRVTAFATEAGSLGAWVAPNDGAGNNAAVDLQGSVLAGFSTDLFLTEGGGSSAAVSTSWSAYRVGTASTIGSPTVTEAANNLDLAGVDPGFLDDGPAADLRLAHDSPLIDAGDPAFPPFPLLFSFDVRGLPRKRDGDASGGAVVDIGAYEYQRQAPTAQAAFAPAAPIVGEQVTLGATGSDDVDGEPLTHQWAFDDGGSASGELVQHAFATPGDHTATVTVTDPTGLSASASVTVPVQAPPAGPGGGPGGGPPAVDPAPVISGFRLVPRRFAVARRPRAARRRAGTRIRFTLSEAARVELTVQRRRRGRWVRRGRFAVPGSAGGNRRRWSGRLRRRALRPGRYRMLAIARDPAGQRSTRARARFRIIR